MKIKSIDLTVPVIIFGLLLILLAGLWSYNHHKPLVEPPITYDGHWVTLAVNRDYYERSVQNADGTMCGRVEYYNHASFKAEFVLYDPATFEWGKRDNWPRYYDTFGEAADYIETRCKVTPKGGKSWKTQKN